MTSEPLTPHSLVQILKKKLKRRTVIHTPGLRSSEAPRILAGAHSRSFPEVVRSLAAAVHNRTLTVHHSLVGRRRPVDNYTLAEDSQAEGHRPEGLDSQRHIHPAVGNRVADSRQAAPSGLPSRTSVDSDLHLAVRHVSALRLLGTNSGDRYHAWAAATCL